MNQVGFYQILGHNGHFKIDYLRWGGDRPQDFHEYAHEGLAANAIAGEKSTLYQDLPVDANQFSDGGQPSMARGVQLILAVREWGAMYLLADRYTFEQHIMPAANITGIKNKMPSLHSTSDFLSLSPITFSSQEQLLDHFKQSRTKNPAKVGRDDSKFNNLFSTNSPKLGRAHFEQARLLYYVYYGGCQHLLPIYGLPSLPPKLRFVYLAFTPWIDPNTFRISPKEEEPVLDVGSYESESGTFQHVVVEEYESMSKNFPKADFGYGDSIVRPESSLSSTFSALFDRPTVLVVYDWPRTARLLNAHGIDTTGPNWHLGVGTLLGFERRAAPVNGPHARQENNGTNTKYKNDHGRRDYPPAGPRHPTPGKYDINKRHLDDPEYGVKHEPKEETKLYGGRWDASSPIRNRSVSPRSRSRPLADQSDRKYQRPTFHPDEDEQNEDSELPNEPPAPASPASEVHVLDLRYLISILANAPEPREYITYPACARRLGLALDGWCAGNQAAQMHAVLQSLVGGEPIHRREVRFKATPGLSAPTDPNADAAPMLEGIAGAPTSEANPTPLQSIADAWNQSDGEDDDDGW